MSYRDYALSVLLVQRLLRDYLNYLSDEDYELPNNTPAPAFIDLQYATTVGGVVLNHHQIICVNPAVLSGATSTLTLKNATTLLWTTALNALIALLQPLHHTSTIFIGAELWSKPTPSSDPIFIATAVLGTAGTSGTAPVSMAQTVIDFKGTDDSDLRFTILEGVSAANVRQGLAAMSASYQALVAYLYGATSFVYTRGNAYLSNVGFLTTKTNDRLRKKRMGL